MPRYKLYYFDAEGGAGEPIRNAFKLSGIAFDDVRIPWSDWPSMRSKDKRFLFMQIPILEIDGVPYAQSNSILRFIGKLTGLYPTDHLHALRADEIMDCFMDIRGKLSATMFLPKDVRGIARDNVITRFLKPYYRRIEERIKESETQFSAGNSLTIADLVLFNDVTSPFYGAESIDIDQHPAIARVIRNVKAALGQVSTGQQSSRM